MEFDKEHILSVAETIRQQLIGLTNRSVLMSWGITQLTATAVDNMAALKLTVNGRLHKGDVIIALNEGTDYYEVYLKNKDGRKKIAYDIDFTQLGEIIDTAIESGNDPAEYEKFCSEQRALLFGHRGQNAV